MNNMIEKKMSILNQIKDLKRTAIKHKAILSFKYSNLMLRINLIQVSVIFISTGITFIETLKSQYDYKGGFWDLIPIILATYIALVTAILRFFKWEDQKEEISKSKENHIFIINKFIKTKNVIESIELNNDNIENWTNVVATYENDTFDNYINIRETFDSIMNYKDVIFYKNKFKNLYLEMELVNNDIENIHINKKINSLKYKNKKSFCNWFCCEPKINHLLFFNDIEKKKDKSVNTINIEGIYIDDDDDKVESDTDNENDEKDSDNNDIDNNTILE